MCLPDFVKFAQIEESDPITGYRIWRDQIKDNSLILKSELVDYKWLNKIQGPIKVLEENSGIYAYIYYYNKNNNNYYIGGIIKQYGKVAIHKTGYRSEYAIIDTLFTIRELDAKGPKKFLGWIKIFNERVNQIADRYQVKTVSYQDFVESQQKKD